MPGVKPECIDIGLDAHARFSISCRTRAAPRAFAGGTVHCLEIPYGRFERHNAASSRGATACSKANPWMAVSR
ncbi:hypothetical protein ACU4GD_00060 [Cupriavidus basilensis]